ncbi:hypothetical protein [Mesonia sp. K7]|uniref:hypothetical protein n=1 Tax=Mesonia sp. K7 TaxID=2218606 RepID=UPI000DAA2CCC|nr:hypothetical protein [Mesonia sp. K7]PZD78408.1 hypothetical protein DNG35_04920 [Mesonia sp. K7]
MLDWYSSLDLIAKIYWTIAIVGSLLFILQLTLSFVGGEIETSDVDTDVESDTGIGFQFITFKNLVGFFTIFGWTGIACIDARLSIPITIVISFISGLAMMLIMAAMFHYMRKLNDSGTLDYKNALEAIGEVYLTIGANRSKIGKAQIKIQGTLRELDALTDNENELKSGTLIKVIDVTSNGILIVEKLNN